MFMSALLEQLLYQSDNDEKKNNKNKCRSNPPTTATSLQQSILAVPVVDCCREDELCTHA